MRRQKSKAVKTNKTEAPKKGFRLFVLMGLLVGLVVVFFVRGGVTRLATDMANDAILLRRYESAESWLSFAQRTLGNQAQVEFLLGRLDRLNGDFNGMLKHFHKAHELGFDGKKLNREQVLANLSIGEMDAVAEGMARDWIAELPDDVGLIVDAFVNGLASQSRFEEASKLLEDYEQAFPNDAMVNFRFGVMNEHIRGNARAEKEYLKALEKDPGFVQAAWCLARIRSGQNRPEEAIEILTKFDHGRQSLAVKTFLAHCFQQAGDLEKSAELFRQVADKGHEATLPAYRAVDEVPERFLAASELGVLYVKLGNWEEAKKYLEMALEVNQRDFIARNSYGQVLRRLGLNEQAEKELARIVEERKEYDKITALRDQINQNQDNTAARVEMGKILFKYESERFGLFWIRSALTYDPKCRDAHQFLGEYYAKKAQQASSTGEKRVLENKASYHLAQIASPSSSVLP